DLGQYKILGESVDDAAGEAFDKTAKLLDLSYPGGPAIAQLAEKGNPKQFRFPRPMLNRSGLDFSFSGLKTYVNGIVHSNTMDEQTKANIAYEFQAAVIDTLTQKAKRALIQTGLKRLVVAGGVAANKSLREQLGIMTKKNNVALYYPRQNFCTDNGAMIAYLGYRRLNLGQTDDLIIKTITRCSLDKLTNSPCQKKENIRQNY
ncbi:MAG: tRNA (adenosine(37)-N6)-threonylcarbamoyltransferase complex transferase subunit TsaD, partial [Rickettsiella sp.]|nr:tRNA (adenosine(37)-N6)-threonylcarbamoyltransferase complex transferase subunit TsaD [Rickettsiella sp.]